MRHRPAGDLARVSVIPDEGEHHKAILPLGSHLVVLTARPGTGELNASFGAKVAQRLTDGHAAVVRIDAKDREEQPSPDGFQSSNVQIMFPVQKFSRDPPLPGSLIDGSEVGRPVNLNSWGKVRACWASVLPGGTSGARQLPPGPGGTRCGLRRQLTGSPANYMIETVSPR